jgi:EAL and modified HD-GYP domain-containing signal transduction protein
MTSTPLLFARQPVLNSELRLFGYEVLYRSLQIGTAEYTDPDVATATVSAHAVLDVGLDVLAGSAQVFFNVTPSILAQRLYEFLPSNRVLLDIDANAPIDGAILRDLERAKESGYRIALDDFVMSDVSAAWLPLADVIKVEVPKLDHDGLRRHAETLARPGLRLLAEKVETPEIYRCCLDAGYDLFQGYFFARPELVTGSHVPPDRALILRLLAEVQSPLATIESLEKLVVANTALSYKVLRYVNSALHGVPNPIESIRHAITMLGIERLRICASMLLLAGLDSKPQALVVTALLRARFCQLIGRHFTREDPQKLFTVGLMSMMDSFLDRPMEELLKHLPLAPDIRGALLYRGGPLGRALEASIAFERRDEKTLVATGVAPRDWNECYVGSLTWTKELSAFLES